LKKPKRKKGELSRRDGEVVVGGGGREKRENGVRREKGKPG
jgi:hypothetical protein